MVRVGGLYDEFPSMGVLFVVAGDGPSLGGVATVERKNGTLTLIRCLLGCGQHAGLWDGMSYLHLCRLVLLRSEVQRKNRRSSTPLQSLLGCG